MDELAHRLRVSKSEALRRAIHHLAQLDLAPGEMEIAELDELQLRLGLTGREADAWASRVRRERLGSSTESSADPDQPDTKRSKALKTE